VPNLGHDYEYLIKNAKVLEGDICYEAKASFSVVEVFNCRYELYKRYYFSREVKAIDLMLRDMFYEANVYYNFKEYIEDSKKYLELKDDILQDIQFSENKELEKARNLAKALTESRQLYKCAGETIYKELKNNEKNKEKLDRITEEEFDKITGLNKEYYAFSKLKLACEYDEGAVSFYDKNNKIRPIPKDEITLIIPFDFTEHIIRIYCKQRDKFDECRKAFSKFCKELSLEDIE